MHEVTTDDEGRTLITLYVYDPYWGEYVTESYAVIQCIEGVGAKRGFMEGQEVGVDGGGSSHLLCAWSGDSCLYMTDSPNYQSFGCEYNDEIIID